MEEKYFKRDLEINIENSSDVKSESTERVISEVGNTMTEYFIG